MNDFNDDLDLEQEEDKIKLEIAQRERDTDRRIKSRLNKILRKNENQLLFDDKQFLKARASYLTKGQREEYADIINADYSGQASEEPKVPGEPKLEDLSREELDAKASELGIDKPEELPNKKAVIEAIKNNQ